MSAKAAATSEPTTRVTLRDLCNLQADARRLRLPGHQAMARAISGQRRNRRPGRGMDFAEVRPYQPGDDIRSIDWRVTARRQETHTKLFQQELERPLLLVCDLNPSLYFASTGAYKSVRAAQATALLAWLGLFQDDRVGGVVLSDTTLTVHRPARRRSAVLRLLQDVVVTHGQLAPADHYQSQLDQALREIRHVARTGSRIMVISDFYGAGNDTRDALRALSQHNEVTAIRVEDPLEQAPPPPAQYGLASGGGALWLNSRREGLRNAIAQQWQDRILALENHFKTARVNAVTLRTNGILTRDLMACLKP